MQRFAVVLATIAIGVLALAGSATAAAYKAPDAVKVDVMGEWAHPDDDTSIIGPCGVWHQRYGVRCGLIMVTRGEGGGNAVGSEIGPALGLRRENEDRVAHFRSGTVDIFNLDRVDFFYNTSAPLTQFFWGQDETLRRITRIIRMTQPEIYIGFTPTLAAFHGNHQQAGRYIWEGVVAAADPNMFPEQLRGPRALSTWQVKKVFSGGNTRGTGGTNGPHCLAGFAPEPGNLDAVAGVWLGYDSPYNWPAGNVQGQPAGTPKSWAQVHNEGRAAYPTQSRLMYQETAQPSCSRFGMTQSFVPFQPNASAASGRDDAILLGATKRDPGGLPKGTLEYLTLSRFYNVPGDTFQTTVHVRSGKRRLPAGRVRLDVPPGWQVERAQRIGPIRRRAESTATFDITPSEDATVNSNYRISALLSTGGRVGYTDNVVRLVSPVEGRFQRWGKWEEYDGWLRDTAPQAARLGRSPAAQSIGVGETISIPVDVHNWSGEPQSGEVGLTLPGNFSADATSKPYGTLAPGADATVRFELTNTDSRPPANRIAEIGITTSHSAPPGGGSEQLAMSIVPTTTIPEASGAPQLDATESAGEYGGGPALDVGQVWEGGERCSSTDDCGKDGGNYAKVARHGDELYFFVHVRDDFQSYAVKPSECVAHWLADSVEILIDPRGTATQTNRDTASTFKLGIFPYTDDPANFNGNGANGPCWARDADNHQGYSTGPLADTVVDAPNAPGVEVASSATWVGDNQTSTDHAYAGGGYNLEVKIPMASLPSAVDPERMGLNITPYDNDDTAAPGTTTLRHIDQSARLAWSPFGSVQSDPWRWGHATVSGYMPPADRPTTPSDPKIATPLNGVESPQTIAQSARNGVPISGRPPAPAHDRIARARARLTRSGAAIRLRATGPGTARIYLWSGEKGYIPVWETSCSPLDDPPPDYGMTACAPTDGSVPPWSPDMSGRVVSTRTVTLQSGRARLSIPLGAAERERLARDGSALISFETPGDEVQALDIALGRR